MKIEIVARPEFRVPLTEAQVGLCIELSRTHYDGDCRMASAEAGAAGAYESGFLTVWLRGLISAREFMPDEPVGPVYATWTQVDTLLKILENTCGRSPEDRNEIWYLTFALGGAIRTASELAAVWKGEFTHEPRKV